MPKILRWPSSAPAASLRSRTAPRRTRRPALVRVPFSRQQAPEVSEPTPPPVSPERALKPLSPELALVSPELAEEARAKLPERPWEKFTQLPEAEAASRRDGAAGPAARPGSPAAAPRSPPRRRLPRVPVSTLVLIGLTVFMAITGALPARDAPSLLPAPPKAKPAGPRAAGPAPLVAGAIYVEGDPAAAPRRPRRTHAHWHDRGAARARRGASPSGPPSARDGSFRGTVKGSRREGGTGSVIGRFGPRTTASGVIRVRRAACDSGPVLFVAGIPHGR